MVIKFPPRFLHPFRSVLGREVFRLAEQQIAGKEGGSSC
jgi:hypothetical protein